jgi:hypothetical protein
VPNEPIRINPEDSTFDDSIMRLRAVVCSLVASQDGGADQAEWREEGARANKRRVVTFSTDRGIYTLSINGREGRVSLQFDGKDKEVAHYDTHGLIINPPMLVKL